MRTLGFVLVAVIAALVTLTSPRSVLAHDPDCEVLALGRLSAAADTPLAATGRWTTEDCDSRFRTDSDAHTYSFEVAEGGRVRIDLASPDADPYLYLMAADGARITDNDDGAADIDARIERMLQPGSYLIEATTVGGRGRGSAGFTLSVVRLSCEPVDLGLLVPGEAITASGTWTIDTCGSQIVAEHPAVNYTFLLPEAGRVRIDLESDAGDPVLSLASPLLGVIGANDDGGGGLNSRIEQYLPAGPYVIEATTYGRRDRQPLVADFTLVVNTVDEAARQQQFLLKVEDTIAPDEVVAGEPFAVDYRVGNLGGGDLPAGASVMVYAVGPGVFEPIRGLPGSLWDAGASYHSGERTASATSSAGPELGPHMVTFNQNGPAWVFVGMLAFDESGEEISFHGIRRNVRVLSGPTFGPVAVTVDGAEYEVTAVADGEGIVATTVASTADPSAEIGDQLVARATYAAAVRTLVLDGIFERDALASPAMVTGSAPAEPAPAGLANASSDSLLAAFAGPYVDAVAAGSVVGAFAGGEAVNPLAVEEIVLGLAGAASARYAHYAAAWSALHAQAEAGGTLSFADARAVRVGLAYAERVLAPAITAGEIVTAARAADLGWNDPAVRARVQTLAAAGACGASSGRDALEAAGMERVASFAELQRELRAALPVHAAAVDAVLCGVGAVDAANAAFLRRIGATDADLASLDAPDPAPELEPAPHSLRIMARLADDGRVEHRVELVDGRQVVPTRRFLPTDAETGRWYLTSGVEAGGGVIGTVQARRLADGRIEWRFVDANDEAVAPAARYMPAGMPPGVWFRSTEIDVPPAPAPAPPSEE